MVIGGKRRFPWTTPIFFFVGKITRILFIELGKIPSSSYRPQFLRNNLRSYFFLFGIIVGFDLVEIHEPNFIYLFR